MARRNDNGKRGYAHFAYEVAFFPGCEKATVALCAPAHVAEGTFRVGYEGKRKKPVHSNVSYLQNYDNGGLNGQLRDWCQERSYQIELKKSRIKVKQPSFSGHMKIHQTFLVTNTQLNKKGDMETVEMKVKFMFDPAQFKVNENQAQVQKVPGGCLRVTLKMTSDTPSE